MWWWAGFVTAAVAFYIFFRDRPVAEFNIRHFAILLLLVMLGPIAFVILGVLGIIYLFMMLIERRHARDDGDWE